jgi:hypothetical protein
MRRDLSEYGVVRKLERRREMKKVTSSLQRGNPLL